MRTSLENILPNAKDATRADIDTQLEALTKKIRENLRRISNLTAQGHYEKAGEVCQHVATHRARVQDLIAKRNEKLAMEPLQDVARAHRPGTRIVVTPKRQKRFSKR